MTFSLAPLADLTIAQIGFALGCALLTAILLRRAYKTVSKRKRVGSGPPIEAQRRPSGPWDGALRDADARFDRQQVELYDLARDLNGQLDSKTVLLRELIAQSERQIARLEALLEEAEGPETRRP